MYCKEFSRSMDDLTRIRLFFIGGRFLAASGKDKQISMEHGEAVKDFDLLFDSKCRFYDSKVAVRSLRDLTAVVVRLQTTYRSDTCESQKDCPVFKFSKSMI